jgi:hypothetical protein
MEFIVIELYSKNQEVSYASHKKTYESLFDYIAKWYAVNYPEKLEEYGENYFQNTRRIDIVSNVLEDSKQLISQNMGWAIMSIISGNSLILAEAKQGADEVDNGCQR